MDYLEKLFNDITDTQLGEMIHKARAKIHAKEAADREILSAAILRILKEKKERE